MLRVTTKTVAVNSKGNSDLIDITPQIAETIKKDELLEGNVLVFVAGSTAALTTIEYEPGLIQDLQEKLEELVPEGIDYQHNQRWGDGNGHSHLRASLIGPSLYLPVKSKQLMLGTWQQVILIDCDNRPRQRKIILQLQGKFAK